MQNEALPRREREKIRRRHEIFDAALNLFSEKGYHNVSMHEIGEKAEFAIGTLYKFFDNKEELYKALVLEQVEKFRDAIVQAISEPDEEIGRLRNYVRVKGEVFGSNLSFIRLFLAESSGASFNIKAGLDEEVRKGDNNILELLASIFESGIKSGRFKEIASPYSLAVALDSVVNAFLLLSIEEPAVHSYPENPDTILDIFFRGLLDV